MQFRLLHGQHVHGVAGSVKSVGGAGPAGVLQMQLELVSGGPGVVMFTVLSDFTHYAGGVYVATANATVVGAHAVSLIGWGVDPNGVPYWLCQNSWGPKWGEGGFFRIRRGTDECTIESMGGLTVVKPQTPTACPTAQCANGAVTLKDCTCRCDNGLTGPTCSTCALKCQNGGVLDAQCSQCACPLGFFGTQCEGGYTLTTLASCSGDSTSVTVTYSFAGTAAPPTQTSLIGFFALTETRPLNSLTSASICGAQYPKYNSAVNGGLCPTTGSVSISPPTAPGQYQVTVANHLALIPLFEAGRCNSWPQWV